VGPGAQEAHAVISRAVATVLAVAALAAVGCGEKEEPVSAAAATPTPTATPTATATAVAKPARSLRQCLALWNADEAIGSTHQVSHTEFLAELAQKGRTPVSVIYQRPDCYVVAPIGRRRIAWFVAARGRAPFTVPERRNLKPGETFDYNGRALRDGRIDLR
jgi:hypothetical protein